jgi:serine/threonine protein kinase
MATARVIWLTGLLLNGNRLSRESGGSKDYYRLQRNDGQLPLRWTAPEVLASLKWTFASDVYSFGVTVCELYEQGCPPFFELTDNEVMALLVRNTDPLIDRLCPGPNMPPDM